MINMGKIKQVLGDNIRELRIAKGWTQVYVADRLQITAPFLAQIESGKRGTSLELVESIAVLFEIPIASLFLEKTEFSSSSKSIRAIEIDTVEKQLKENILENITKAFNKFK